MSVAPLRIRKVKPSPTESLSCNPAPVEAKKVDVAPLNVKKMRRRGFSTSLRLVLPPSPLPLPRSPLGKSSFLATPATPLIPPRSPSGLSHTSTPQTALTFTAEWDLTQRTFVFTPFQSSYSPSAISPLHAGSPVPDDVANEIVVVSPAETSVTSPFSPLDSPSVYSATTSSVFSHDRIGSPSTAPSSAADINSKSDVPSASLSRQITLHLFREELQRAIPSDTLKCNFDKGCYEDLDEDLLMAPMDVFSQMLWESTDPEAPVPHEEVVNYSRATFEPKRPLKISINTKSLVERKSPSVEVCSNIFGFYA